MTPGLVYAHSGTADVELTGARTALSPAEIEILVLIDGKTNVDEIMKRAAPLSGDAVQKALEKLLRAGIIVPAADVSAAGIDPGDFFSSADQGVASLKKNGYFVCIAQAAMPRKPDKNEKLGVLVVEDDEKLAKLVRTFFKMEGFETRIAGSRAALETALREARPSLVLLDVTLPDADGLDLLAAMRKHPVVKEVPIVMMTAKATREAVLQGIKRGANGYVTKPFNVDVLLKAAKSVLGLK
jgi:CheY-like chemotaxis protein